MDIGTHKETQPIPEFLLNSTDHGVEVIRCLLTQYYEGNQEALTELSVIALGGIKIAQQTVLFIEKQGQSNAAT